MREFDEGWQIGAFAGGSQPGDTETLYKMQQFSTIRWVLPDAG
jgi:hypothetical protein